MSEGPATAQKSGAPDPLIGRVIAGRFRITALIARGGMGKVYRAEQAPLGRVCAIKVLNPNYNGDADPEFHRRFFREASITSKIMHPNSVTIFDYGKTEDDIYFMAMEYLEGKTLHMALREGGVMPELRAGRIASQVCRALREAHKLGVIHRDLKPANIFLTRPQRPDADGSAPSEEDEDFVKVLDFGLVKHLSERPEEQLTQTGLFMGSPKYMAPEQIQGGHVDERTDIYSLGIIMYEMLAGKVPFERATSVNILMAHVGEPPPPMREVNPNLVCSPAFEDIVMCCIAKDPNQRFSSMDHLLGAIRRAHGGSMTGQLAAVVAASGHFAAHVTGPANAMGTAPHHPITGPPPPMASASWPHVAPIGAVGSWPPPPSRIPGAPRLPGPPRMPSRDPSPAGRSGKQTSQVSASHTAMQMVRGEVDAQRQPPKARSKAAVAFGILVAAIVGGGLGMLAFKYTSPEPLPAPQRIPAAASSPSVPPPVTASAAAPAPGLAPSASPSVAPGPASAASTPVKVTSDPAGAVVREDTRELCAATPCEVALDWSKPHKLVLTHAGFKPEMRTVRGTEGTMLVRFGHPAPIRGGSSPLPSPPSPGAPPASIPTTTE